MCRCAVRDDVEVRVSVQVGGLLSVWLTLSVSGSQAACAVVL